MRIGIDARFYGSLGKGLGRYTSELIKHLEKIDDTNEYVVFLRKGNWDEYEPKDTRFTKVLAEFPWYSWKEQFVFPFRLLKHKLDLMHFPHFNVPMLYRSPFVVTVHDLILLRFPTPRATTLAPFLYKFKYLMYRLVIASALRRAKTIITVSEFSKKDILDAFSFVDDSKIVVTYEACAAPFVPDRLQADKPDGSPVPEIDGPYFLYVGNAYPHKNLERLIEAFQSFRAKGFDDHWLLLVGGSDYFYERLKEETETDGRGEQVIFYGHASDAQLAKIYDGALSYVFPSMFEGFGLPPLEAMYRMVPVVSSSATCLPEVLGDAALFFDPKDQHSITDAMIRMTTDPELRTVLLQRGSERVKRYSWDELAQKTKDIYERGHRVTN